MALGKGTYTDGTAIYLYPFSRAKLFPEYVPRSIREDYRQAHAIKAISPNASAALSRRCLQGIIRDVWDIRERTLNAEINRLRDCVSSDQWKAIDAIRKMGNIGAHMERDIDRIVDIEPNEAEAILRLVESLIEDWYISKRKNEAACEELISLGVFIYR